MNTPTPTPRTNAAIDLYAKQRTDSFLKSGNVGIGVMWVNYAHELEHELTRLRADLAIAENWVEHHSTHANDLIGENTRLRAENERLTGWLEDPHALHAHCLRTLTEGQIAHLFGERMTAIVNRAEKAEAEVERWKTVAAKMSEEREHNANEASRLRAEVERLHGCCDELHYVIDNAGYPSGKDYNDITARAERAEAALADWSVLKGWGGTPEIIHEFIKGQQNRIHHCQDLEAELITERARLDYLGLHMGMPQVSEALNLPFSQCFPIRDAIDLAMKNESTTP